MDVLKKMFGKSQEEKDQAQFKDEFRKPTWFEDSETDDDELFDTNRKFVFQMFTSPFELQKYFDQQMHEILRSIKEHEGDESTNFDRNLKDEYLKPGFEENFFKEFKKNQKPLDTDLDGEIYADQLHSLLHRLSPEIESMLPKNSNKPKIIKPKVKLSDEEKIMAIIHGTNDEEQNKVVRRKEVVVPKLPPHFGGVFEGTYQGPKMFGQSIMTQTIRKPDGSYETKKIVRDTDGNIKTTITRSVDGKTETITTYGDEGSKPALKSDIKIKDLSPASFPSDRNIFVSKNGYALPKNLW